MIHFASDVFAVNRYGFIISTMPGTTNPGTKLEMNTAIVGPILDDQYSPDMFYLVESKAELLFVTSKRVYNGQLAVYRVDTKNCVLEPVISISSRALFLGRNRCISVDSSKVPTVQASNIYYADNSLVRSYDYDALAWEEEATYVDGYVSLCDNHHPFALYELLAEYYKIVEHYEQQMVPPYGEDGYSYYDYYDAYASDRYIVASL
jgi:hypothetical protein